MKNMSDSVIEFDLTSEDDGKIYFRMFFYAFGPCL
jgi:hypothetical protein